MASQKRREILAEARRALGIEHLVLMIHDVSFPSRADEDSGRGSPYSRGARDLLEWAQDQGFTGLQLGPQGETSETNPSPYDGTTFSKTILSVALWPLAHDPAWEGILDPRTLDEIVRGAPRDSTRADHRYVFAAHRRAIREAFARIERAGPLWRRFETFRAANASWLDRDARYESLCALYGTDDWRLWPKVLPDVAPDEVFSFGQFVVHEQHAALVRYADESGLKLFGDFQIGTSHRDRFGRADLYLTNYLMGAPPSRTNPDGQPWGYPIFIPGSVEALALLRARVSKLLSEFHGLRIDHPHGHVCPWVYDAKAADPVRAVNEGARLFESPDLPDQPELARYAIVRPEQLNRTVQRYADGWVTSLDEEQVDAYASHIDVVMQTARDLGRSEHDILFEVLSTCPRPLDRVMHRYGLGRFRVTQKADPRNRADVYSTYSAHRGDWVMLGNHDTPTIWRCVQEWPASGKAAAWCDHLEARLGPSAVDRAAVALDPAALAQPMLADLLASDAGRVAIFVFDLLGSTEVYNSPGTVSAENWSLRAGTDFAEVHATRAANGCALHVPRALATALRARGHATLAARIAELC